MMRGLSFEARGLAVRGANERFTLHNLRPQVSIRGTADFHIILFHFCPEVAAWGRPVKTPSTAAFPSPKINPDPPPPPPLSAPHAGPAPNNAAAD